MGVTAYGMAIAIPWIILTAYNAEMDFVVNAKIQDDNIIGPHASITSLRPHLKHKKTSICIILFGHFFKT